MIHRSGYLWRMAAINLRTITTQDPEFAQVWALREDVLRIPLGLSLRDEDLSGEAAETIIIALNEQEEVTGCVMMRHVSDQEVKLRQMAVAPALQGQGIGMALLNVAQDVAEERGYKTISLHARQTAVPFYQRAGYVVQGEAFAEVGIPHFFMNKSI